MFLYSPWFLAVLGIASLFFLYGALSTMQKSRETAKNKKISEQQFASLQAEDVQLSKDIESLQTDAGLEKVVRSRFNVVKEGEGVILVVDAPVPTVEQVDQSSGFVKFLKKIFQKKTKAK